MGWAINTTVPAALPPGRRPCTHCIGGWVGPQGRSGWVRKISPPPRFDPRTVQPVVSRYTDWAIPAHVNYIVFNINFIGSLCSGDLLIIGAQVVAATQMVLEEKFVSGLDIPALQAVGWEGKYFAIELQQKIINCILLYFWSTFVFVLCSRCVWIQHFGFFADTVLLYPCTWGIQWQPSPSSRRCTWGICANGS